MDVLYVLGAQTFVWDAAKAQENLRKHGIRFEHACEVFSIRMLLTRMRVFMKKNVSQ